MNDSWDRVKSTDPEKPTYLKVFKALYGATKITSVKRKGNKIRANLFKGIGDYKYEYMGEQVIVKEVSDNGEISFEPYLNYMTGVLKKIHGIK